MIHGWDMRRCHGSGCRLITRETFACAGEAGTALAVQHLFTLYHSLQSLSAIALMSLALLLYSRMCW